MDAYKTKSYQRTKHVMWYKVKEFNEKGLNFHQISMMTGLHRETVSKYAHMTEEMFLNSQSYKRQYNRLLDPYTEFVRSSISECPFLSAAQIEDWLKERYDEFPKVSSKTVYNFVKFVRCKYDLPKTNGQDPRDFAKLPDTPFGEYAQVDFGEQWMQRANGNRVKVYFFAMVLSRSRQKFVYVSESPFTTSKTIYAHELAFAYYGGKPRQIIYDQDKVIISDENLGDVILTKKFATFAAAEHLQTVFCRKADPQSKGKVENVVKYVKYNFLRGRRFYSIEQLQDEALAWLERTGNGTVNGSTYRIPNEVFKEEKTHLTPYMGVPTEPTEDEIKTYHVRKDNVITYHGSFYTVPLGTYRGEKTYVWANKSDGRLIIYSNESGKVMAIHKLAEGRGDYICIPEHRKEHYETDEETEAEIISYMGNDDFSRMWLKRLHEKKRRYYFDNLKVLRNGMKSYPREIIHEALIMCLERYSYNARMLLETAQTIQIRYGGKIEPSKGIQLPGLADITPEKTNINQFTHLFE